MNKKILVVGHGSVGASSVAMQVAVSALKSQSNIEIAVVGANDLEECKDFIPLIPLTKSLELKPMSLDYERFFNDNPRSKKRKRPRQR